MARVHSVGRLVLSHVPSTTLVARGCRSRPRAMMIRSVSTNGTGEETYDYDLFTIGAGSGGVRAARQSASRGTLSTSADHRVVAHDAFVSVQVPEWLSASYLMPMSLPRRQGAWVARAFSVAVYPRN